MMGCDDLKVKLVTKAGPSADGELPHWLQMYPVRPGLHPSAEKRQFRLTCPNTLSSPATSWLPCCHLDDFTPSPPFTHSLTSILVCKHWVLCLGQHFLQQVPQTAPSHVVIVHQVDEVVGLSNGGDDVSGYRALGVQGAPDVLPQVKGLSLRRGEKGREGVRRGEKGRGEGRRK